MPLDALCLSGLVHELNTALAGAKIDKIHQPGRDEVVLAVRTAQGNAKLLLSANPSHPRPQLTEIARENPDSPPMFCMLLRKYLSGGRILEISQPPLERVVELKLEALDELAEFAWERGARLAVENMIVKCLGNCCDELLEIVSVNDKLRICFDVNHLLTESISDFIRKAGKYIITMHVSDNDGIRERHFFPGDGVIDWKGLFSELKNINYDSYMIAECGVLANFPDTISEFCEKWRRLHA